MKQLRVQPIKNGTVIDHITAGGALKVLAIIDPSQQIKDTISLLMNVPSKKYKKKDIVKIENIELKPKEIDKIALIASRSTINIIRNYKVVKKHYPILSGIIRNIIKCPNPNCISNSEQIDYLFNVVNQNPIKLMCYYCTKGLEYDDITENIIF